MNVKRYQAPTAREALRALKAELGADAIVLSNRAVEGGVEILALPAESVGAIHAAARRHERQETVPPAQPEATVPAAASGFDDNTDDEDYTVSLSASRGGRESVRAPKVISPFKPPRYETADYLMRKRDAAPPVQQPVVDERFDAYLRPGHAPTETRSGESSGRPEPVAPRNQSPQDDQRILALQQDNARLMTELCGIRGMIERQLAGFAWNETRRNAPAKAQLLGELLEAGFSTRLARELVDAVADDSTPEQARSAVRGALARDLRAMSCDADLIDRGGVFALVGPTGVGKTTTTAKIAARCVVRHGADKLALITTDGYRIGAQEQLRIYGRILGVPVFPVRDAADLRQTLAELREKHMVLIDTVGMSQRDRMVAQQAAMLLGAGPVKRLLLLNATARGDTLDDVVRAYGGSDLAGCILTKVDEAASLAPAIGAAISHGLELLYVTNGQRVPEDLHLPNRSYLLHRALRGVPDDSAWHMQQDEVGMMMAAGGASVERLGGYGDDRRA